MSQLPDDVDTFSYADPTDPRLKRFFIRLIERLAGQPLDQTNEEPLQPRIGRIGVGEGVNIVGQLRHGASLSWLPRWGHLTAQLAEPLLQPSDHDSVEFVGMFLLGP